MTANITHRMWLRINDIFVGVVTGLISAVIAASLEAAFAYARIMSFGQAGGSLGSKLPMIAIIGAIVGGIVGFGLSAVFQPRRYLPQSKVPAMKAVPPNDERTLAP